MGKLNRSVDFGGRCRLASGKSFESVYCEIMFKAREAYVANISPVAGFSTCMLLCGQSAARLLGGRISNKRVTSARNIFPAYPERVLIIHGSKELLQVVYKCVLIRL